jgi:hypothetical protein
MSVRRPCAQRRNSSVYGFDGSLAVISSFPDAQATEKTLDEIIWSKTK